MSPMQRAEKVVLSLVLSMSVVGCAFFHPARESAFAVKGKILANNFEKPSDCVLELYRLNGNQKVQEINVPQEFQRSFVIAPGVDEYYMLVHCPGSATYRTPTYKLGSNRYLLNPIDLGEINLTRLKTD
jgi:hypothetical protein